MQADQHGGNKVVLFNTTNYEWGDPPARITPMCLAITGAMGVAHLPSLIKMDARAKF